MKYYKVTFDLKKNGLCIPGAKIIQAQNAKEAKANFETWWFEAGGPRSRVGHAFHIKAAQYTEKDAGALAGLGTATIYHDNGLQYVK